MNPEKTALEQLREFIEETTLLNNRGKIIPRSRRKEYINSAFAEGLSEEDAIKEVEKNHYAKHWTGIERRTFIEGIRLLNNQLTKRKIKC